MASYRALLYLAFLTKKLEFKKHKINWLKIKNSKIRKMQRSQFVCFILNFR